MNSQAASRVRSGALFLGLLALLHGSAVRATGWDKRDVYLRVMARSTPVRSGPGGSYREIGRIGLDQVYEAIDRSADGAWYRIRLARGLAGWVLAELVWPFELSPEGAVAEAEGWMFSHVLGTSHLADGALHLSLAAGGLDRDGLFELRLGFGPSRHYWFEISVGQSVGGLGSLLTYGAEILVAVGPWRTVVPFAAAGAGGVTSLPHRDNRLFEERTRALISAGGGLLLALQADISLRLDVRRVLALSEDDGWGMLSILGGVMLSY